MNSTEIDPFLPRMGESASQIKFSVSIEPAINRQNQGWGRMISKLIGGGLAACILVPCAVQAQAIPNCLTNSDAGNLPANVACISPDLNTTATRLGGSLLDAIPISREDAIWTVSQLSSNALDDGFVKDRQTTGFAAIGADKVFGRQDRFLAGGGVGFIRARGATPREGLKNIQIALTGYGPIGYISYRQATTPDDTWELTAVGAYMFLSVDGELTNFGLVSSADSSKGRSLFFDASALYSHRLAGSTNSFIMGKAGFRLADHSYSSASLIDRDDTALYAHLDAEMEASPTTGLFAVLGVDVPLSRLELGTGVASGKLRAPNAIFEYQAGIHWRADKRFHIDLRCVGAQAGGLREIGGYLSFRFVYDRRGDDQGDRIGRYRQ